MKKAINAIIILLTILTGGCLTNSDFNTDFESGTLIGKIYDKANLPCANVNVIVNGETVTISDINGRFFVNELKKGKYILTFSKEGYREDTIEFEFISATQSLYHKMISMDQILDEIETALDNEDYTTAYLFLTEGAKIDQDNPILNYLLSIYYYRLERYTLAVEQLELMVSNGYRKSYIYMTLTDIYEYKLNDFAKANESILKYLELVDDTKAKARQKVLNTLAIKKSEAPSAETNKTQSASNEAEDG